MSAIGDRLREFADLADKNPDWTGAGCVATPDGMVNQCFSTVGSHDDSAKHVAIGIYHAVLEPFERPERPA